MGPSSSSRSYSEFGSFDTSWLDSNVETAILIPPCSANRPVDQAQPLSLSGGITSPGCNISAYLTTPKSPERARKHKNYKLKSNPVLTAADRLEEIRKIEEEKKNLLQKKIEIAEKKAQQKVQDETEKKKRVEERKKKAEESKLAREEKQRNNEERKRKCEVKKAELEREKKRKLVEREMKAEERKRKQEAAAAKKREKQAKKKELAQLESSEESEVEKEDVV